jgi:hypothetical protein
MENDGAEASVLHPGAPLSRMRFRLICILSGIVLLAGLGLRFSGSLLVLNNGVPSDVAIVQGGDDRSFWVALAALRRGEVQYVLLDLARPDVDNDFDGDRRSFVADNAPECADRILSVPLDSNEYEWFAATLSKLHAHSVLLIAPEFRSRLDVARFSRLLPQYRLSIGAVPYPDIYDRRWWRRRAWAKRFALGAAAWVKWTVLGHE